jgi:hypothetical protein
MRQQQHPERNASKQESVVLEQKQVQGQSPAEVVVEWWEKEAEWKGLGKVAAEEVAGTVGDDAAC